MKLKTLIIIGATVSLLAAGCNKNANQNNNNPSSNSNENTPSTTEVAPTSTPAQVSTVEIMLNPLNNSGQSGKATLIAMGDKTKVIVNITGKPSTAVEPEHIHMGQCPNPGQVTYPLTSIGKGAAQTIINVSLQTLLSQQPFAINVHKSATQINTYMACGDSTAMKVNPSGSNASSTPSSTNGNY